MNKLITKSDVITTLKAISKKEKITPERIVEVAKDENSLLHNYFEWDDTKAGEKYRLFQAKTLLTSVRVELVSTGESSNHVKTVIKVEETPLQIYAPTVKALDDEEIYKEVVKNALREIKYWENKYHSLKALQGVVNVTKIEELEKEI